MRVITFSKYFPAYHPRKGERTFFIEKIVEGMLAMGTFDVTDDSLALCGMDGEYTKYDVVNMKFHTIRAGNRWKVGDYFSPRVWSGKPYASKQIEFAPPIEIKKIFTFSFFTRNEKVLFSLNTDVWDCDYRKGIHSNYRLIEYAKNDGLELDDFMSWFKYPKPFSGQIIIWDKNINY